MNVSAIRVSLLMSALAAAPSAASANTHAAMHGPRMPIDRGFLTQDDVALFRGLMQALEVVKIVHADEDTLAYLHSSQHADTFKFTIGGKPWLVRVAKVVHEPRMAQEIEAATYAGVRGWGPAVMPVPQKPYILLTEFIEGAPLRPEQLGDSALRSQLLGKLAGLHGAPCTFAPRPKQGLLAKARRARQAFIDSGRQGQLDDGAILARLEALEAQLGQGRPTDAMAHQDLRHDNVLVTPAQEVVLVNWGNHGCGEPFGDLANLALAVDLDASAANVLLQEYLERAPTPQERLHFATVMGILEIDGYYAAAALEASGAASPSWAQLFARLSRALGQPSEG